MGLGCSQLVHRRVANDYKYGLRVMTPSIMPLTLTITIISIMILILISLSIGTLR